MCNIELLKRLCMANGVSGFEDEVREIIIKEISGYVDNYKIDNLGNIICFKKGRNTSGRSIMVCAHMDEVGLIVSHITEKGYVGFGKVGGIDSRVIHGINVSIGKNRIPGVIGINPIHMFNKEDREEPPIYNNLLIDIGAENKEQALKYVSLGDSVCFDTDFNESHGSIMSKALDDRAGCAILLEIIKQEIDYDTYFVFSVQEEVGLRGARAAAYSVNPDSAIVIETTTACDIPDIDESRYICRIGEGTVISFMDHSTVYDKEYYNMALTVAHENGINIQVKQGVTGGNDSGAIHLSRSGVRTLAASLPCRYLHSPRGIISLKDYDSTKKLLSLLMKKVHEM